MAAQGQSSALDPRLSPEPATHLPQSSLLHMLLDTVGAGAVRVGCRVDEVHDTGAGPVVAIGTSDGSKWQLSCDFLVAADGANSSIRCAGSLPTMRVKTPQCCAALLSHS